MKTLTPDTDDPSTDEPSDENTQTVVQLQDHDPSHFEQVDDALRIRGVSLEGNPGPELVQKLCQARKQIGRVPKSGYNSKIDHEYSTYDDVNGAVGPVLADVGLWIFGTVKDTWKTRTGKTRSGNPRYTVSMVMEFTVTDGKTEVVQTFTGENEQHGDAHHYALQSQISRYALSKLLMLESGDPEVDQEDQSSKGESGAQARRAPEAGASQGSGKAGSDTPVALPANSLTAEQRKNAREAWGLELDEDVGAYLGTLSPSQATKLATNADRYGFTAHTGDDARAFLEENRDTDDEDEDEEDD